MSILPVDTASADFGGGLLGERDVFVFDFLLDLAPGEDWVSEGAEVAPLGGARLVYFFSVDPNGDALPFAGPGTDVPNRFGTFFSVPRPPESSGRFNSDYAANVAGGFNPPSPTPIKDPNAFDLVWFDSGASATGLRAVLRIALDVSALGLPLDSFGDVVFVPSPNNGADPAMSAIAPPDTQIVAFFSSATGVLSQGANLLPYNGAFFATTETPPSGAFLRVDARAAPGGDGSTWALAFHTLADAVDAVNSDQEIHVAAGVYGLRSATQPLIVETDGGPVKIRGGFAGLDPNADPNDRDPARYASVITGDILGNDASGDRADNALTLLLVKPGVSLTCDGLTFCAAIGGAIDNEGELNLRDCLFEKNEIEGSGGAIRSTGALIAERCVFSSNAADGGGAIDSVGSLRLANCLFTQNEADLRGGAVHSTGDARIARSRFVRNTAAEGGAIAGVGATDVLNCELIANQATVAGGGVWQRPGSIALRNSAVIANIGAAGPALWAEDADTLILNAIVYDHGGTGLALTGGAFTVTHSVIEDGVGLGFAVTDVAPQFRDPLGPDHVPGTGDEDLRPDSDSVVIDAGCNSLLLDPPIENIDLFGHPRFADDPNTADTGCGPAPLVDIGPYEFPGASATQTPCRGDVDGDRMVGLADLAGLLADFGGASSADLNCDGVADLQDLAGLLSVFGGVCP